MTSPARKPLAWTRAWLSPALWLPALACAASSATPAAPSSAGAGAPAASKTATFSLANKPPGWNAAPTNGSPGIKVPPLSGHNLLKHGNFDEGKSVPWMTSFSAPATGEGFISDDKEYCVQINDKGVNRWDVQIRHREMNIQKGHTYAIQYKAHATQPTGARLKVGMSGPPYKEYWADDVALTPEPQLFKGTFKMNGDDDATAEFAFHLGGNLVTGTLPLWVCVDDVQLDDPQFERKKDDIEIPLANVLTNQNGYLPKMPKVATVKSASTTPLEWELKDAKGKVVASGKTTVFGADAASGDHVHEADFSSFTGHGKDFTLAVGKEVSHPFAIEKDVYKKLKYDALALYYQNRSGVDIKMPFAQDPKWARPAGHLSDSKVACLPDSGCSYTLDVSGGWYDAGDHGKYVVNGGIAVWTMLNQWERALALGESAKDFGDGKLNIPEHKNGQPDLLDEVKWELEWMTKMQVPAGQPLAGMVHHKIHDKEWTALGLAPADDPVVRYLWPASTAATLNYAAVAAQGARVWKKLDPKFSAKLLETAEKAWAAALAHPAIYAGSAAVGGGPYDDTHVSDEFYWAAAELFITTAKDDYKTFLTKSPHFKEVPTHVPANDGDATSFMWSEVQGLGTISLAVVPNKLPPADIDGAKKAIAKAADSYLELEKKQGYEQPFVGGGGKYPWGSNSFIVNNLVVLALAADLTKDPKYTHGVATGMDYILGRNPMDQCYVTGYGTRPLRHPHHRFWAQQANPKFPPPPPGILSGGPNSGLQDPYVNAAGLKGCAPAKCYVDNIEAWSANELAINWNAPLAWVAAWLDEKGQDKK